MSKELEQIEEAVVVEEPSVDQVEAAEVKSEALTDADRFHIGRIAHGMDEETFDGIKKLIANNDHQQFVEHFRTASILDAYNKVAAWFEAQPNITVPEWFKVDYFLDDKEVIEKVLPALTAEGFIVEENRVHAEAKEASPFSVFWKVTIVRKDQLGLYNTKLEIISGSLALLVLGHLTSSYWGTTYDVASIIERQNYILNAVDSMSSFEELEACVQFYLDETDRAREAAEKATAQDETAPSSH